MTKQQLDAIREAISFDDVQLQHAVDLMAEVQLLNEENTTLLAVNEGEPWAWQVLVKQRDEAKQHLSNLLARIFRDGGHYETQSGTNTAVVAADRFLVELFREVDEGFKRGAEAMRKAISEEINSHLDSREEDTLDYIAHIVKTFAIPEDN
jgi:hypothetical protein